MRGVKQLIFICILSLITGCNLTNGQVYSEKDNRQKVETSIEVAEKEDDLKVPLDHKERQWVEIEGYRINIPSGWYKSIESEENMIIITNEKLSTVIYIEKKLVDDQTTESNILTTDESQVQTGQIKELNYVKINTPPKTYTKKDMMDLIQNKLINQEDVIKMGGIDKALKWFNEQQKATQYIYIPINDNYIISITAVIGIGEEESIKITMNEILDSVMEIRTNPKLNTQPSNEKSREEKYIEFETFTIELKDRWHKVKEEEKEVIRLSCDHMMSNISLQVIKNDEPMQLESIISGLLSSAYTITQGEVALGKYILFEQNKSIQQQTSITSSVEEVQIIEELLRQIEDKQNSQIIWMLVDEYTMLSLKVDVESDEEESIKKTIQAMLDSIIKK